MLCPLTGQLLYQFAFFPCVDFLPLVGFDPKNLACNLFLSYHYGIDSLWWLLFRLQLVIKVQSVRNFINLALELSIFKLMLEETLLQACVLQQFFAQLLFNLQVLVLKIINFIFRFL